MIAITTPAIDILVFTSLAYAFAYFGYTIIFKKDFAAVTQADLKFSIAMILLVVANYWGSGILVSVWGLKMHWLLYYFIISGLIEIIYFLLYKRKVGLTWKQIVK